MAGKNSSDTPEKKEEAKPAEVKAPEVKETEVKPDENILGVGYTVDPDRGFRRA